MTENHHDQAAAELQPAGPLEDAPTAAEDAPAAVGVNPVTGTVDAPIGADVAPAEGTGDRAPAGEDVTPAALDSGAEDDQAEADVPDPSEGMAGVDVTQPNPYAGPLGYAGKFASDAKAITDSEAPDELDAGAGDQLDVGPADQLDQQPPA